MADIFLSYATDDRDRVAPLVAFLQRCGWSVWWDRDLRPGETWPQVIDRELDGARCVVVAWSKHALVSPWVRLEADRARIHRNMVPVQLDDASVPPEFLIYQTFDMRNGAAEASLQQLKDGVAEKLRRRRVRLGGIGAGTVAAAALVAGAMTCAFTDRCGDWSILRGAPDASFAVIASEVDVADQTKKKLLEEFVDDLRKSLRRTAIGKVSSYAETQAIPGGTSPIDIGKRLKVRWLLALRVTSATDAIKVAVELIDTSNGYLTDDWSVTGQVAALNEVGTKLVHKVASRFVADVSQVSMPTTGPGEAYNRYLEGRAALRDGASGERLNQAEEIFRSIIERWPSYAPAEAALCEVDLTRFAATRAMERFASGEAHCNRALELDASSSESTLALGKLYLLKGQYDRAQANFARAVAESSQLADAHIGLGDVAVAQHRDADAEREFHAAVDAEPGSWRTYNALGNYLFQAGRAPEALAIHRQAEALVRHDPVVLNNIGAVLYLSGQMQAAIDAWKRAIELAPLAPTYSNLAGAYYLLGDFQKAVATYELSVALEAHDYRTWTGLADARAFAGRPDEAAEAYGRAAALLEGEIALNPDDPLPHAFLAAVKAALDDRAAANAELERALATPGDWQLLQIAAITEFRLDRPDAARVHIDAALRAGCPKILIDLDPALRNGGADVSGVQNGKGSDA